MNTKQKQQFNLMVDPLRGIARKYKTPAQLKHRSEKDYWLEYEEALELAYESIQVEAKYCIKGINKLK